MSIRVTKPPLGSQINWGHPLSQGLVGCWLMNEGGGKIIKNSVSLISLTSSTNLWKVSTKGIGLNFSSSSYASGTSKETILSSQSMSIVCSFKRTTAFAGTGNLITRVLNSGATEQYRLLIFSNNNLYAQFQDVNSQFRGITLGTTQLNKDTFCSIVYNRNGGNVKGFQDGLFSSGDVINALLKTTYLSGNFNLGMYDTTVGQYYTGIIYYVYIWNRVLSSSEISSLYVAPYQFIQPIVRRFYSIPSTFTYRGTELGAGEYAGAEYH